MSAEEVEILKLLRDALQEAKGPEGRIPTAHVDHVYLAVKNHILGNKRTHKQKRIRRQKTVAK
jgi:hypothetical protein